MRAMTESEFETEALPALRRVFVSDDPVDAPASPTTASRAIWYPVGFRLELSELQAIESAARGIGETAMYVTVLERPQEFAQDRAYHWFIPFEERGAYEELGHAFVLENAIYSTLGTWGVMISQLDHAIVAGTSEFVSGLFRAVGSSPEDQMDRFLDYWRAPDVPSESSDWIPGLLTHVFGPRKTADYLSRLGRPAQ